MDRNSATHHQIDTARGAIAELYGIKQSEVVIWEASQFRPSDNLPSITGHGVLIVWVPGPNSTKSPFSAIVEKLLGDYYVTGYKTAEMAEFTRVSYQAVRSWPVVIDDFPRDRVVLPAPGLALIPA